MLNTCSGVFAAQERPTPIDLYMFAAAKKARTAGIKKVCSKQSRQRVSYSYNHNELEFYLTQQADRNIQTNRIYVSGKVEDAPEVMKKRLLVSLRHWQPSFAFPTKFTPDTNTTYAMCLKCNAGPVSSSPMFTCLLAVDFVNSDKK